jgi:hypothetical protein
MHNHQDATMPINNAQEAATPGAFDTQRIEKILEEPQPDDPPVMWEGVLAAVTSAKDETEALSTVHRSRYDSPGCPGAAAPLFARLLALCEKRCTETNNYIASLRKLAAATDPFLDEVADGTLWTTFDIVKVAVLALVSVALLTIGVFTVSQILLSSGLPGFENPIRRYLFSCVPVGGAFALKNIGSLLGTDRSHRRFIGFVQLASVILAIAWAWLFVSSFKSGPMSSAADVLAELMADAVDREDSGESGSTLLFVGLLAEMFLAAGCWLEIERLVLGHRRARRTPNPLRAAIDKEIDHWTDHLVTVTALASRLEARLRAIECGRATYVACALNHYRLRCRGLKADVAGASTIDTPGSDGHETSRLLFNNRS